MKIVIMGKKCPSTPSSCLKQKYNLLVGTKIYFCFFVQQKLRSFIFKPITWAPFPYKLENRASVDKILLQTKRNLKPKIVARKRNKGRRKPLNNWRIFYSRVERSLSFFYEGSCRSNGKARNFLYGYVNARYFLTSSEACYGSHRCL